jgi:uncharacterized membrane protein YciS (DUF1049 family)
MSDKGRVQEILENRSHQRVVLVTSVVLLLLLEVMIYFAAAGKAGRSSMLVIRDHTGNVVYQATGNTLSGYEKLLFEETHGPLSNYQVQVQSESHPFPTRMWLSAAVGMPIGLILLVAFLIRVFLDLFYGEKKENPIEGKSQNEGSRLRSPFFLVSGFSIFHAGLVILSGAVLFWLVPDFLLNVAKISMTAVQEFKWLLPGLCFFMALLIIWIVYLRYRLSKQMMENQLDLEKCRLQNQLVEHRDSLLLPDQADRTVRE